MRTNTKQKNELGRRKREEDKQRRGGKEVVAEMPAMATKGPWRPPWLRAIHEKKMIKERDREEEGKKKREGKAMRRPPWPSDYMNIGRDSVDVK